MLTEQQREIVKHAIEEQIVKFFDILPQFIETVLKQATLEMLHIHDNGKGGYRFNKPETRDWVTKEIQLRVESAVRNSINGGIVRTAISNMVQDPTFLTTIYEQARTVYRAALINSVRNHITDRAKIDADKAVRVLASHITFNPFQDPTDPNSFNSPLGEVALLQLAKELSESDNPPADPVSDIDQDEIPF